MRLRSVVVALLVGLSGLPACSAMSPGSDVGLHSLSPFEVPASDIRIAIIAPEELVLRPGGMVMTVGWQPSSGSSRSGDYELEVLSGNAAAPHLASRLKAGQRLYVLRLTDSDATAILSLQREVEIAKTRRIRGRGVVSVAFRDLCWRGPVSSKQFLPLDVYMRTQAGDEWFPLMTNVNLRSILGSAGLGTLSRC